MSATKSHLEGRRIGLRLDPGMLVEALILERLASLPKRRHPDWIRSLLVQGFLAESRIAQRLDRTGMNPAAAEPRVHRFHRRGFDFADWRAPSQTSAPVVAMSRNGPSENRAVAAVPSTTNKPFAHLRKVVG